MATRGYIKRAGMILKMEPLSEWCGKSNRRVGNWF